MSTPQKAERRRPSKGTRRFGYAVAIVVEVALLIVVNNLVEWDIAPFITEGFNNLVPYINVSLVASMVVNIAYFAFDPRWFRSLTQAILNVISLIVIVQTYRIFPFDFSGSDFNWTALTRTVLVVLMVLVGVGIVGEIAKMLQGLSTEGAAHRQNPPAAV
ncbi:MAG: hypothetical protein WBP49_05635 [Acidimicrobiia bacterium]